MTAVAKCIPALFILPFAPYEHYSHWYDHIMTWQFIISCVSCFNHNVWVQKDLTNDLAILW